MYPLPFSPALEGLLRRCGRWQQPQFTHWGKNCRMTRAARCWRCLFVSEIRRSPCFSMTPPPTLRTSPHRVLRKPSHRWHSGGLDTLFLSGHGAAVHGQNSAARARGGSAREPLRQRMRSSTWDLRAALALYRARPLAHTVSLCISTFQFLLVRKDHCFGRRNFFFSCSKTAALQEIKDLNTMTKLFCSWVFELLTFKWLNFYKVRFLTAFIHSVFKRHKNGTCSNTDRDRRNDYLIYKLLGMTSLQSVGVGWTHKVFMNLSAFRSHHLQILLSHIGQLLKGSNDCIFLVRRKQLQSKSWVFLNFILLS